MKHQLSTGDYLRRAADTLRRLGWCQLAFCDDDGRRCAISALADVPDAQLGDVTRFALQAAGVSDYLVAYNALVRWNDAEERTAEQVIDTFELAAVLADEAEKVSAGRNEPCGAVNSTIDSIHSPTDLESLAVVGTGQAIVIGKGTVG